MTKNQTRKTPADQQTRTPQAKDLPPIVAAVARMLDPDIDGIDATFLAAWQAAPAVFANYTTGNHDARGRMTKYQFIGDHVEAEIARSRAGEHGFERYLSEAYDLLDRTNEDYRAQVENANSDPAFNLGLALGLYILTSGGGVR